MLISTWMNLTQYLADNRFPVSNMVIQEVIGRPAACCWTFTGGTIFFCL